MSAGLLDKIRHLFHQDTSLPSPVLQRLLRDTKETQEQEFCCGDVYALLDQYAEADLRGEEAERLMPLVKHHLEMCTECREEYEALLKILEKAARA
jgi:hypothetical protein